MPRSKFGTKRLPHSLSGKSWTISARVNPITLVTALQFLQRKFPDTPLHNISQITAAAFDLLAVLGVEEGLELMESQEDAMHYLSQHCYGRNAAIDNLRMRDYAANRHKDAPSPTTREQEIAASWAIHDAEVASLMRTKAITKEEAERLVSAKAMGLDIG